MLAGNTAANLRGPPSQPPADIACSLQHSMLPLYQDVTPHSLSSHDAQGSARSDHMQVSLPHAAVLQPSRRCKHIRHHRKRKQDRSSITADSRRSADSQASSAEG